MNLFFFLFFGIALGSLERYNHANRSKGVVVGKCPEFDGKYPVYLPDLEDCSIYYKCDGGHPIKLHCPPETDWNFNGNKCDTRIVGKCEKLKPEREKFFAPVGFCPLISPLIPVNLPDDYDCSVFYKCVNGFPYKFHCPNGDLFDVYDSTCVYPESARCFRVSNDLRDHKSPKKVK